MIAMKAMTITGSGGRQYEAQVHNDEDPMWAEVAALPGCYASGRDDAELGAALTEAVALCELDLEN
jgi:predicted RNase H-like HicB family nuclease